MTFISTITALTCGLCESIEMARAASISTFVSSDNLIKDISGLSALHSIR